MPNDWDAQRDIAAEGQRAAVYHASKNQSLPSPRGRERLVGVGHNGERVDNVTADNRYDVDARNPWIKVHLLTEDKTRILHTVFIPNTRERPDAITYGNKVFEVVTTRLDVPQYREIMVLNAVRTPPQPGD